jgi:hypothetical protein
MITEYAQLLSTAHRVIDGEERIVMSDSGRRTKQWVLFDHRNSRVYKSTHVNHPSTVWVRQSKENYDWLYSLFVALNEEYTYRYGRIHKCRELYDVLKNAPTKISLAKFTEPTPAMPGHCVVKNSSVESYWNYYRKEKQHIASWAGKFGSREIPNQFL